MMGPGGTAQRGHDGVSILKLLTTAGSHPLARAYARATEMES